MNTGNAADEALLRRVTFDLIGLPPPPEEIGPFGGVVPPTTYDKMVDRLLASPHYGEYWGVIGWMWSDMPIPVPTFPASAATATT